MSRVRPRDRRRLLRRGLVALVIAFLVIPTASAGAQATTGSDRPAEATVGNDRPVQAATGGDRRTQADLVDIEDEVMCIVCKRPLSTSGGDAATDQRNVIQGFIDEGLTKPQVKNRLVAEYGEAVLVNDRSPIAAAAPVIAALVGAASILLLLRRRRIPTQATFGVDAERPVAYGPTTETARSDADPGDPSDGAASPEDDARIDAELGERG